MPYTDKSIGNGSALLKPSATKQSAFGNALLRSLVNVWPIWLEPVKVRFGVRELLPAQPRPNLASVASPVITDREGGGQGRRGGVVSGVYGGEVRAGGAGARRARFGGEEFPPRAARADPRQRRVAGDH